MAELIVRCPACGARMKVPPALQGKESIRCPKCKASVPLKPPPPAPARRPAKAPEPVEEVQDVQPADEFDELEEVAPAPAKPKRRPPPEDEEDDEDDRPVRKGRRRVDEDEDDEDEDDRPRRGRKRRRDERPGPWLIALALAPACALVGFLGGLVLMGTRGLPEAEEGGPAAKVFGLGFMLLICGVLVVLGIIGVKNRYTVGRWGMEFRGTTAVWIGMTQTVVGGLLAGFGLYGLLFEVFHLLFG
jgi:DNA-directed RNA polymerase subunit RPC12/RpoP